MKGKTSTFIVWRGKGDIIIHILPIIMIKVAYCSGRLSNMPNGLLKPMCFKFW